MERVTLGEILQRADGFRAVGKNESVYEVAEATNATLLCHGSFEMVSVERVARIELGTGHIAATTRKGEVFYFPYEQILGLRLEGSSESKRDGGAGFR